MIDFWETYVAALCFLRTLSQELPPQVHQAIDALANGYVASTGIGLALLAFWFEGATPSARLANQRALLRGLAGGLVAGGVAAASALAWRLLPGGPELAQSLEDLACWQGPPAISAIAAVGFALGTALWRRDWRWGLGILLAAGLWGSLQVVRGLAYPLDVVIGSILGAIAGSLFGSARWPDRRLDWLIRLARRLTLA